MKPVPSSIWRTSRRFYTMSAPTTAGTRCHSLMRASSWPFGFYLLVAAFSLVHPALAQIPKSPGQSWVDETFAGGATTQPHVAGIKVRRQDHADMKLGKPVWDQPIQIGKKRYQHGLGTHSTSEIVISLPQPAKRFQAEVGIDNNADTAGKRGSVSFAVEVAGKRAFESGIVRGGQEPVAVDVKLNAVTQFTLHVTDGGDGAFYDQADWADARVTLADGTELWLERCCA